MKKAGVSALGIVLAASMVLGGCGSGAKDNPTASSKPTGSAQTGDSQKPVTLKFWGGVPPESGPQEVIDNWNKDHPNIKVEYTRYVNDDAGNLKLETALLSNSDSPDIFMSYGDERIDKRVRSGMAAPLDDLIAQEGFDVEGVIGGSNIRQFPDGKYYYLPANKAVGAVLINKSALDEVGEKVPTAWTWDDFAALAKKLNKGERKGTAQDPALGNFGMQVLTSDKPLDAVIAADGSTNFNSPALKKGLEMQKELEGAGVMVKYSEAVAGKLTYQNELLTEKAAMVPAAIYLIRYIKDTNSFPHDFQIAFAPIPQYQAGGNVNVGGGMGDNMSINKNSPNKEAAMKFINWYLTEGNMAMLPGGRIPSSKKADPEQIVKVLVGDAEKLIDKESLLAVVSGSYTYPTSYNVPASVELNTIYKEEMEKYLLDAQSIDKTLEAMKSRGDAALKNAK